MATEGTGPGRPATSARAGRSRPAIAIAAGETVTLAEIEGPGAIQHIWITTHCRQLAPAGAALLLGRRRRRRRSRCRSATSSATAGASSRQVSSLPVAVNPTGGFNCYWEMPFRKQRARITLENLAATSDDRRALLPDRLHADRRCRTTPAYFHAQWRRSNPLPYKDGAHAPRRRRRAAGHYVGTYLAWGVNNNGWWGEGEIKFFMDGDGEFPTICGTGTEDYFGGAWNFEYPAGRTRAFSTPFLGMPQVIRPDGLYQSQQRFGMYRWHVMDPIRFDEDLRSRSRRSAGAPGRRATCRCRTTSPRPRSGTPGRPRTPAPRPPTWTPSKSSDPLSMLPKCGGLRGSDPRNPPHFAMRPCRPQRVRAAAQVHADSWDCRPCLRRFPRPCGQ